MLKTNKKYNILARNSTICYPVIEETVTEIRVLRYFLEAAREGGVTHAAERLHISQPALSKRLKAVQP